MIPGGLKPVNFRADFAMPSWSGAAEGQTDGQRPDGSESVPWAGPDTME